MHKFVNRHPFLSFITGTIVLPVLLNLLVGCGGDPACDNGGCGPDPTEDAGTSGDNNPITGKDGGTPDSGDVTTGDAGTPDAGDPCEGWHQVHGTYGCSGVPGDWSGQADVVDDRCQVVCRDSTGHALFALWTDMGGIEATPDGNQLTVKHGSASYPCDRK